MRLINNLALCFALSSLGASLQAQSPRLTFEVVSIKPNNGNDGRTMIGLMPGGRFTARNIALRELIVNAYRIQPNQLSGAPGWISNERFDIEAKPAGEVTQEQIPLMLQALLEERFHFKAHRETKDGPVYELIVAKGGLKMPLSADQTPLQRPGAAPGGPPPGGPNGGPPAGGPPPANFNGAMPRGGMRLGPGSYNATAIPVSQLINAMARSLSRPIIDKTGLTGLYDVDLKFTPEQIPRGPLPPGVEPPPIDPNGPTIYTALQEQLGLKLDSATGPVELLIVDAIERPTEN
jgi:uncharacterized protein (TIGR03435 family)